MKPGQNYVFFLGGLDLEMLTIKEILMQQSLLFYDKQLPWNDALASHYNTEIKNLTFDQVPIFIELGLDTPLPKNAILIDHHNSDENKKSSLEQIAELLHIELSRWQKLIATNDKGYIPAMWKMCIPGNFNYENVNGNYF